jgi:Zn-finger protein
MEKDKLVERIQRCINDRIDIIIKSFNYNYRRAKDPDECPCNGSAPCHDLEDLNCFFCYCPYYKVESPEGGCKLGNPYSKGKWYYDESLPTGRIWDCSDCPWPHEEENVRQVLSKLFNGRLT